MIRAGTPSVCQPKNVERYEYLPRLLTSQVVVLAEGLRLAGCAIETDRDVLGVNAAVTHPEKVEHLANTYKPTKWPTLHKHAPNVVQ